MNEFLKLLLSLSISGTLLLLLILGLKPFYKHKFSRRWQYYIWLIAVLRFLLPLTPDITIVGNLFETFDTTMITNGNPVNSSMAVTVNTIANESEQTQENKTIATTAAHNPLNVSTCLFFIWAACALLFFVRKITLYQSFIRSVKTEHIEITDIKVLNLLSDCKEKLHIRAKVELSYNTLISSPMMTGFFHPHIILPDRELTKNDLSYVFMHELIHYRHRDLFYKWLIQFVVCIHWFNPFVYLLERYVNQSCELSCDETMISMLDDTARREYGDMLISFMKTKPGHLYNNASVTLTEGAEQLKERLGAIMKFQKKSKSMIVITTILTIAICFCFFATGAYAAPSAKGTAWKDNEILNEVLTEDGRSFMSDAARTIETNNTYTYVHRAFFSDSYIIGMGWNLNDTIMSKKYYTDGIAIPLKDHSTITVYFGDMFFSDAEGNAKDYLNDSNAISAIGNLIYYLKSNPIPNYPTLETPLVTNITYVGENISAVAQESFESGDLTSFSAIFPVLDTALQKKYCQKIYDEGRIAFFSSIIPYMDRDLIMQYADQAEQDMKSNFFSAIVPYMQSDDLNRYAEKYYETDNIALFTAIVPYMTASEKQEWLTKAQADHKNTFSAVLSAQLPD